jgi:hypothetical protein
LNSKPKASHACSRAYISRSLYLVGVPGDAPGLPAERRLPAAAAGARQDGDGDEDEQQHGAGAGGAPSRGRPLHSSSVSFPSSGGRSAPHCHSNRLDLEFSWERAMGRHSCPTKSCTGARPAGQRRCVDWGSMESRTAAATSPTSERRRRGRVNRRVSGAGSPEDLSHADKEQLADGSWSCQNSEDGSQPDPRMMAQNGVHTKFTVSSLD